MYVYMCMHVYVCMCLYVYVCIYMYMYVCIYVWMTILCSRPEVYVFSMHVCSIYMYVLPNSFEKIRGVCVYSHMCVSVPIWITRCFLVAIFLSICSCLAGHRERMATLGRTSSSSSFSTPSFYEGGSSSFQLQEQGEEVKSGPNNSTTVSGIEMVDSNSHLSTTKGWGGREPLSFFWYNDFGNFMFCIYFTCMLCIIFYLFCVRNSYLLMQFHVLFETFYALRYALLHHFLNFLNLVHQQQLVAL